MPPQIRAKSAVLLLATALALLALAPAARAEYLVPEGNSAVNQYTQGVPSAGGQKGFRQGETLEGASPTKKLGKDNTKKLNEHGAEGREVAEIAAQTAPEEAAVEEPSESQGSGGTSTKPQQPAPKANQKSRKQQSGEAAPPKSSEPQQPKGDGASSASGSSGASGILAAATGAEDGHLGLLLPLLIVAALIWGSIYAYRGRTRPDGG